jgi:hypothetical protein
MSSSVLQKITAPIHRSTAYDFNVQLDHTALRNDRNAVRIYGASLPDEEHLSVKEHEILVRRKHRDGVHGNGRLQVFSSLNAVAVDTSLLAKLVALQNGRWVDEAQAKNLIVRRLSGKDRDPTMWGEAHSNDLSNCMHQLYEYVGVAITPQAYVSKHSRQESQGFACTRGGLNTLINNGKNKIKAGQKVYISFRGNNHLTDSPFENPSHHASGIPHSKALVTLENKDRSQDSIVDDVLKQMHRLCKAEDNRGSDKWFPLTNTNTAPDELANGELCIIDQDNGPVQNPLKLIVLKASPQTNGGIVFVHVPEGLPLERESIPRLGFEDDDARVYVLYHQNSIVLPGAFKNMANQVIVPVGSRGTDVEGVRVCAIRGGIIQNADTINTNTLYRILLGRACDGSNLGYRPDIDKLLGPHAALGTSLSYMLQQVIDPNEGNRLEPPTQEASQFAHLLRHTVKVAIKAHEMQRRDPIGVAVSGARPGEPFDIVLHG